MLLRLYVHNFRCLENFDFKFGGKSSVLLIGQNGSGKTTVGAALEILQKIGRGVNGVYDLLKPKDLTKGGIDAPLRFLIEAELEGQTYVYELALELRYEAATTEVTAELDVHAENLSVDNKPVFRREGTKVQLGKNGAEFHIDHQLAALPIIQQPSSSDPISVFKLWLGRCLILRPLPVMSRGDSNSETLEPDAQVQNFGAWFSGVLAHSPAVYSTIHQHLKQLMPDLVDIKNPKVTPESRNLLVYFGDERRSVPLPYQDLSDGEKCFLIFALVLAANKVYGPLLCFWDEPDNYLALSEVGHFVTALRRGFQNGGQLIATSHNPEAIRRFSDENTFLLDRKSHLDPTVIHPLTDLKINGDLVGALTRGDLEP